MISLQLSIYKSMQSGIASCKDSMHAVQLLCAFNYNFFTSFLSLAGTSCRNFRLSYTVHAAVAVVQSRNESNACHAHIICDVVCAVATYCIHLRLRVAFQRASFTGSESSHTNTAPWSHNAASNCNNAVPRSLYHAI